MEESYDPYPLDDPNLLFLMEEGYRWLEFRRAHAGDFVMAIHPDGREVPVLDGIPNALRLPGRRRTIPTSLFMRLPARIDLRRLRKLNAVMEPIMADLTAEGFMQTRILHEGGWADVTLGSKQRLLIKSPHDAVRALFTRERQRVDVCAGVEELTLRGLHSASVNLYAPACEGGTHIHFAEPDCYHTLRIHTPASGMGMPAYEAKQYFTISSPAYNVNVVLSNRLLLTVQEDMIEIDRTDGMLRAHILFARGGREPIFMVDMLQSVAGPIHSIRIGDEGPLLDMTLLDERGITAKVADALYDPLHMEDRRGFLYQTRKHLAKVDLLSLDMA